MLTRISFPGEAILLSGLMQVGFSFLVRLVLLATVFAAFGLVPATSAPLFLVGMLIVALTGFAIGVVLTPARPSLRRRATSAARSRAHSSCCSRQCSIRNPRQEFGATTRRAQSFDAAW